MTENPALRQHLSHPRKTTPSSDENCITLLTRKASGYLDILYSVGQDRASGVDRPSTVPLAPDQNLCHNISRQRVTPESPAGGEVSAVGGERSPPS